ncbi:NADPH-dependent FMN reductase [Nakamurella sp. GG22]
MTTVKIILASTRPGSSGPAIGAWVADRARNAEAFDRVEVLDLAQVNLPFLDEPEHPRLGRYTHPHTLAWSQDIDTADALIIVTPEYNGGFPAPLKNALDFLHAEWRNKALGFVTYSGGPRGGAGAAAMLAPVTAALGLVTTDAAVAIPRASAQLIDGTFMPTGANEASLAAMLDELASTDIGLAPLRTELALAS